MEKSSHDSGTQFGWKYICFDVYRNGFLAGCIKVIGLDGYFLKRLFEGDLLVAIERDGNEQMFPISWLL